MSCLRAGATYLTCMYLPKRSLHGLGRDCRLITEAWERVMDRGSKEVLLKVMDIVHIDY